MKTKRNWSILVLVLATMAFGLVPVSAPAQSAGKDFVMVKSLQSYSATVDSLQRSIKSNGLMVMGNVNQKAILSMTGLKLEGAESFLVGNPRVGKELFGINPAVASVIPSRISVWADHGTTYVGYFKPSAMLGMISSQLVNSGTMLDEKFEKIVQEATK